MFVSVISYVECSVATSLSKLVLYKTFGAFYTLPHFASGFASSFASTSEKSERNKTEDHSLPHLRQSDKV